MPKKTFSDEDVSALIKRVKRLEQEQGNKEGDDQDVNGIIAEFAR